MVIRGRSVDTDRGTVVPVNRVVARSELAQLTFQGMILEHEEATANFSLVWTHGLERRLPGRWKVRSLSPFLPPTAQADDHALKLGFELPHHGWVTNLDDWRLTSVRMLLPNARWCQIAARLPELTEARLRIGFEWRVAGIEPRVISVVP